MVQQLFNLVYRVRRYHNFCVFSDLMGVGTSNNALFIIYFGYSSSISNLTNQLIFCRPYDSL